jgi:hypothetical protein
MAGRGGGSMGVRSLRRLALAASVDYQHRRNVRRCLRNRRKHIVAADETWSAAEVVRREVRKYWSMKVGRPEMTDCRRQIVEASGTQRVFFTSRGILSHGGNREIQPANLGRERSSIKSRKDLHLCVNQNHNYFSERCRGLRQSDAGYIRSD